MNTDTPNGSEPDNEWVHTKAVDELVRHVKEQAVENAYNHISGRIVVLVRALSRANRNNELHWEERWLIIGMLFDAFRPHLHNPALACPPECDELDKE